MVAVAANDTRWIKGTDGRTRFRGQPRRGRMVDGDLNAIDSRHVRAAVEKAEAAILNHLETRPKSLELVEALAQLDLAMRFVGDIESRPPRSRPNRRPGSMRLPGF